MGSLEEETLLQMVHDFIESESTSPSSLPREYYNSSSLKPHSHFRQSTRYFTLQEILRKNTQEERRIQEKVRKLMKNKMDMDKTTALKQWIVKCLILDGFQASLCHTSWVTTSSCSCGSYEYIEIVEEDTKGELVTIVLGH